MSSHSIAPLGFWACLCLVSYTYFLYPIILFAAYSISQVRRDLKYLVNRRGRRAQSLSLEELPAVSLVVAALNEEKCMPEKLSNVLSLDYPAEKLQAIFVSDGSTDQTNEILAAFKDPRITTLLLPVRQGKANALNEGVALALHQILVFSDASTMFEPDAIRKMVRHFVDDRNGVVCGSLQFSGTVESRQTEGVYWQYESMLRLMEARLGATLTASGAIYAVRRECYRPVPPATILDDFLTPMNARTLGYRVLYDPEAVGTEVAAETVSGEFTRRVRLAAGSFRALPHLLRGRLRGFALMAFVSHKLMRWIVPFPLIGILLCSLLLLDQPFYRLMFVGEIVFLLWAAAGLAFRRHLESIPGALVGYFLVAMNTAFLVGFVKSIFWREIKWHRTT